jgi:hypothetical protein
VQPSHIAFLLLPKHPLRHPNLCSYKKPTSIAKWTSRRPKWTNPLIRLVKFGFHQYLNLTPLSQIIAARPKNVRRGSARRTSARTQILGAPVASPSTRARQAAAAAAIVAKASPALSQPTDKIIVSNLPQDVNEIQIKVYLPLLNSSCIIC